MILVTGATGNVGGALVARLSRAGAPVRALVRSRERGDSLRGFDVDCAVGSFEDLDSLERAVEGVERVFLLTRRGPRMAEQELAVVRALRERAPRARVVKLAEGGVDAAEPSPVRFVRAHQEVVRGLREAGLAATVLAPSRFMQDLLAQAGDVRSGALHGATGEGVVAHVDARDVAAVAEHVLTTDGHEGATYTITGPEALTAAQVAQLLSRVTGRDVAYADLPSEALRDALVQAGLDPWVADGLRELSEVHRTGSERVTDEVRKATGAPARSLRQFLEEHRAVFA